MENKQTHPSFCESKVRVVIYADFKFIINVLFIPLQCQCHLVFGVLDLFRNILVISVGVGTSDWAFSVTASKTCFALLNFK